MNERLRELRNERGFSQKQIAELIGVSTRAYSHYEQGDREPPIDILKKLCILLEVTSDYLIGLTEC